MPRSSHTFPSKRQIHSGKAVGRSLIFWGKSYIIILAQSPQYARRYAMLLSQSLLVTTIVTARASIYSVLAKC